MQPQSDKQSARKLATTTTSSATTATATATTTTTTSRAKVKVIKSKRPLCHFKFYLDICDQQLTKRFESEISRLGGTYEFLLNETITHFITDKTVVAATPTPHPLPQPTQEGSLPGTPLTPATPKTPKPAGLVAGLEDAARHHQIGSAVVTRKTRQTRADTILSRVRRQNTTTPTASTPTASTASTAEALSRTPTRVASSGTAATTAAASPPYTIWQTEYAERFFKRIQTELKDYIEGPEGHHSVSNKKSGSGRLPPNPHEIALKGQFIKVEAIKRSNRPFYHIFKKPEEWPKVDLTSEDGAFRLQSKASKERAKPAAETTATTTAVEQPQSMTRKSVVTSQNKAATVEREKDVEGEQDLIKPPPPQHAKVQALRQSEKNSRVLFCGSPVQVSESHGKELKESSDKQCGVCEICKLEYDTLAVHLKTKDHELFAKNPENFLALDTLIQASADVNKFLAEEPSAPTPETATTTTATDSTTTTTNEDDDEEDKAEDNDEMEVEELLCDSAFTNTTTTTTTIHNLTIDPLQDAQGSADLPLRGGRPSPALREKSKRINKGKHSSEKFQANATTPLPSPTTPSPKAVASTSVGKKGSLVELQRYEQSACTAATTPTPTTPAAAQITRRKNQNTVISPPIRAMLPPSSLYKVVEVAASGGGDAYATPPRSRRATAAASTNVDSPSLIVKFQKVRQSELQRLNGEAENFMFPRTTRSSSDLPTDVDRQTTSDRARHSISSASLDSSEAEPAAVEPPVPAICIRRRATAVGKRRRGGALPTLQRQLSTGSTSSSSTTTTTTMNGPAAQQQRFPSAPIQPEPQPLKPMRPIKATETKDSPTAVVVTLPEATRKSSRTATAIVTAATTSSQLIRAAVEAAKNNRRRKPAAEPILVTPTKAAGGKRNTKLEDRMGEEQQRSRRKERSESEDNEQIEEATAAEDNDDDVEEGDDDDDDLDEEVDEDDGSDEDYVASRKTKLQLPAAPPATPPRAITREERAARRLSRLTINRSGGSELEASPEKLKSPRGRQKSSLLAPKPKKEQAQPPAMPSQQTSPQSFDLSKSLRLQQMHYAFEQLPTADLWHRVFLRQDKGEENYHTYYGSTQYRKLPYEMGPIPFERTNTSSHCCALCQKVAASAAATAALDKKETAKVVKQEEDGGDLPTPQPASSSSSSAIYKHKKVHLLQRYQQEQQEQQQQQLTNPSTAAVLNLNTAIPKCDSKASTPELMERDFVPLSERTQAVERLRAGSAHSSTSSSCSTTASGHKPPYRNKQLQRIAELPPRKSPREHASTLALVSCIIRQRQDSQSKTNSEVDEPLPITPTGPASSSVAEEESLAKLKTPLKQDVATATNSSPRTTRSQAATPVEELRFATEISENVKRMRRGQNKYDHSPPVPPPRPTPPTRSPRGRRPNAAVVVATPPATATQIVGTYSRRLQFASRRELPASVVLGKRKRRQNLPSSAQRQGFGGGNNPANASGGGFGPGVRKLGTKKGVLEFEMEASALKLLDAQMQYTSPHLRAWQIDKYLEVVGKEYDMPVDEEMPDDDPPAITSRVEAPQTPPPTDCFTSEFDLCDLLSGSAGSGEDDEASNSFSNCRRNNFNLFSTAAMQSYYRKRKSLKSNRTGWPKAQKRRSAAGGGGGRHGGVDERISFKKMGIGIKQEPLETADEEQTTTTTTTTTATTTTTTSENVSSKADREDNEDDDDEDEDDDERDQEGEKKHGGREGGVMTPPATDVDDEQDAGDGENGEECEDDAAAAGDGDESIADEDDDETMADSVEEPQDDQAEIEATDADVEEDDDDDEEVDEDEDEDVYEDAFEHHSPPAKNSHMPEKEPEEAETEDEADEERDEDPLADALPEPTDEPPAKRARLELSPATNKQITPTTGKKLVIALHNTNGHSHLLNTSTPTLTGSASARQRRSTPQLNGTLGSCISPSEKLGDNSDIFTVSSDGLETDLDLSTTTAGGDHQCPHQTPKRKFDISKYAPPNNPKAASSCAAEAATAAAKSLAISQFLKKEVRVTCRRLRAPFRRFRYRR